MRLRKTWGICLVIVAACGSPLRADDAKAAEPAVVVRLKSFDGLLSDLKYLGETIGKSEEVKQIDGILAALPLKNGLAGTGLDTKGPFLFYAVATPDAISSYAALMIPIADEKAFTSFVEDTVGNFGAQVTKGSDGIYAVGHPALPVEVFFSVADKYAYITAKDRDTLSPDRRFSPAKLIAAGDSAVVSASVRIDQVPDMLKQL